MNLSDAQAYAHKIMDTRGLRDMGWRFEFDKAKRRFGCCHFRTKTISLSKVLTELNEAPEVENTILHEIAHAIAGHSAGHGYEWKCVARVLGCDAERLYTADKVVTPPRKWVGTCPNCTRDIYKHRRVSIACGQCCRKYNNNQYTDKYKITWRENV